MLRYLTAKIQQISPGLRKIISNFGWLFADRVLRMGVGLIVTAWLARYLQPEQFGLLNYAIAFTGLFGTIAALGLDQIVVRNIVSEPETKDETLGTAFALKLCSGLATFFLATVTIFFLKPDDLQARALTAIIAACLVFDSLNVIDFYFQAKVQSKYTVWARNTAFITITLIRIALIQSQAPLITFAWAVLAEVGLGALSLALAYKISGENMLQWRINFTQAKALLKESWPLILSNLAIMVYLRIDMVMLGQLADEQSVGIYSSAIRLSEVWNFIGIAIVSSVTPSIVEAKKTSEELYYQRFQKLFNLMALLSYSIAIPITFLSSFLVVLVFGSDYAEAGEVLRIHIWAGLFTFFGWSKGVWIVTEGYTLFSLFATSSGAVMNILLNWWLIPEFYRQNGATGAAMAAAIATVISYAFTDYILCFIYPPARKLAAVMTRAITLSYLLNKIQTRKTFR